MASFQWEGRGRESNLGLCYPQQDLGFVFDIHSKTIDLESQNLIRRESNFLNSLIFFIYQSGCRLGRLDFRVLNVCRGVRGRIWHWESGTPSGQSWGMRGKGKRGKSEEVSCLGIRPSVLHIHLDLNRGGVHHYEEFQDSISRTLNNPMSVNLFFSLSPCFLTSFLLFKFPSRQGSTFINIPFYLAKKIWCISL